MNRAQVFLISVVWLASACTGNTEKRSNAGDESLNSVVRITPNTSSINEYEFCDVYNIVEVIELETSSESLMVGIHKVLLSDSSIYVFDILDDNGVTSFSRSGEFNWKLSYGRGPGEISFVTDIALYDKDLYVLDRYKVIMAYNSDGGLIKSNSFDLGKTGKTNRFSIVAPNSYCIYLGFFDPGSHNLLWVDENKVTRPLKRPLKALSDYRVMNGYNFFNYSDNSYYFEGFNDTIYRINEEEVNPAYIIDFNTYSIDRDVLNKEIPSEEQSDYRKHLRKNYSFFDSPFFIAGNYAFFKYNVPEESKPVVCIYDFDSHKSVSYPVLGLMENMGNKFPLRPVSPVGYSQDLIIFSIYPEVFLQQYKNVDEHNPTQWAEFKEKYPKVASSLGSAELGDNPVLLLCRINPDLFADTEGETAINQ